MASRNQIIEHIKSVKLLFESLYDLARSHLSGPVQIRIQMDKLPQPADWWKDPYEHLKTNKWNHRISDGGYLDRIEWPLVKKDSKLRWALERVNEVQFITPDGILERFELVSGRRRVIDRITQIKRLLGNELEKAMSPNNDKYRLEFCHLGDDFQELVYGTNRYLPADPWIEVYIISDQYGLNPHRLVKKGWFGEDVIELRQPATLSFNETSTKLTKLINKIHNICRKAESELARANSKERIPAEKGAHYHLHAHKHWEPHFHEHKHVHQHRGIHDTQRKPEQKRIEKQRAAPLPARNEGEKQSLAFILRDLKNNLELLRKCYRALKMQGRNEGYEDIPSESLAAQIMNLVDVVDEEFDMLKHYDNVELKPEEKELLDDIYELRKSGEIRELERIYRE